MSDLSIDDFRNVLLDLYLAQRENANLRMKLSELEKENAVLRGRVDEEA